MLKLLSLNPTGSYCYGNCEDISLDNQGLVFLGGINKDKGEERNSNGTGKSSVPDCITSILFEEDNRSYRKDDLINDVLNVGCCPRIVFQAPNGKVYRVTYSRKWKGETPYPLDSVLSQSGYKGTYYYLEVLENGSWIDLRQDSSPATAEFTSKLLGMTFSRFIATSHVAQERGLAFIKGTNADRTKIFTDILNLGVWDTYAKKARDKAALIKSEIVSKEGEVKGLQTAIQSLVLLAPDQLVEKQSLLKNLEADKDRIEKDIENLSKDLEQNKTLIDGIQEEIGLIPTIVNPNSRAKLAEAKRSNELEETSLFKSLDEERDPNINSTMKEVMGFDVQLSGVRERIKKLKGSSSKEGVPCDYCGSLISGEVISHRINECVLEEEIHQNLREGKITQREYLVSEKSGLKDQIHRDQLSKLQVVIQCIESDEKEYQKQLKDLETQSLEKKSREKAFKLVRDNLEKEIKDLRKMLVNQNKTVTDLAEQLRQNDVRIVEKAELEGKVQSLMVVIAELNKKLPYYTWMDRNFGDKGVKSFKFGAVVDEFNSLLQYYIKMLDDSMSVWVTPFRLKKDGSGDYIRDFEVWASDGNKKSVPVKGYSGAERGLIVLAIVASLNRLAENSGTGTNVLFLDEVESCFSEYNFERVAEFIKSFPREGKTVVVIGHSPRLLELLDFDHYWYAIKENGVSTLVVDP